MVGAQTSAGELDEMCTDENRQAHAEEASGLLQLPLEIREMILGYLLYHTQQANTGQQIYSNWVKFKPSGYTDSLAHLDVNFAAEARSAFPSLPQANHLLACRQLRAESLRLRQREAGYGYRASLDVLVNGYRFYPIWTQVPLFFDDCQGVDLTVTLRILSGEAFLSPIVGLGPNGTLVSIISAGNMAVFGLIQPLIRHLTELRDREQSVEAQDVSLRNITLELHCRDLYTPQSSEKAMLDLTTNLRHAAARQGKHTKFLTYCIKKIDVVTGRVELLQEMTRVDGRALEPSFYATAPSMP